MSTNKFTDEFKRDAVAQVEDRGYQNMLAEVIVQAEWLKRAKSAEACSD